MATNPIPLTRADILTIIENRLSELNNYELANLTNLLSHSHVRYLAEDDIFVWVGGERPNYLASVMEFDQIQNSGLDNE